MYSFRHRITASGGSGRRVVEGAKLQPFRSADSSLTPQAPALLLAVVVAFAEGWGACAQGLPHLNIIQPGGMPGWPVMNGITQVGNGVNVTWDGPAGYYQLFQRPNVTAGTWQAIGTPYNLNRNATVANTSSRAFFRVSGPPPQYAGAQACAECHAPVLNTVIHTAHFGAYNSGQFVALGGQANSSCSACHAVGAGLPTGFINQAATPQLAGVQCENCHGPAGNHAANPEDPTTVPRVEVAATMCGGCHNARFVPSAVASLHPPAYEEWNASPHQSVLDELQTDFASPAGATFFMPTCGGCHSGTVRKSLLGHTALPDAHEASAVGIPCTTCHASHAVQTHVNALNGSYNFTNPITGRVFPIDNHELGAVYTDQLRNPLASTANYSVTGGSFASQYNPNINVCAQCHNDRGASWTDWTRPPHSSLQYNMLLGTVGELASGAPPRLPGTHSQVEKQCVTCHMQPAGNSDPALLQAGGHTFGLRYTGAANGVTNTLYKEDACTPCHGDQGQELVEFMNSLISDLVSQVKRDLDSWATNSAPPALSGYGTLAWEYANPGGLSSGGPGPTNAALQSLIHTNIQKARFNLYLVYNDGSGGVHNPFYALELLDTAASWVQGQLNMPNE